MVRKYKNSFEVEEYISIRLTPHSEGNIVINHKNYNFAILRDSDKSPYFSITDLLFDFHKFVSYL